MMSEPLDLDSFDEKPRVTQHCGDTREHIPHTYHGGTGVTSLQFFYCEGTDKLTSAERLEAELRLAQHRLGEAHQVLTMLRNARHSTAPLGNLAAIDFVLMLVNWLDAALSSVPDEECG